MVREISGPVIRNIKISFKVSSPDHLAVLVHQYKRSNAKSDNFFVVRNRFVYIIFISGHINTTKIATHEEIRESIRHFLSLFGLRCLILPYFTVDNITASGIIDGPTLLLTPLRQAVQDRSFPERDCIKSIQFHPDTFSAAFIKTAFGTILVFGSGKYIFVGSKLSLHLYYQYQILKSLPLCTVINVKTP